MQHSCCRTPPLDTYFPALWNYKGTSSVVQRLPIMLDFTQSLSCWSLSSSLFIYPSIHLSIYSSSYLSFNPSLYLCLYLSLHLSIHQSVYLFSIPFSICLSCSVCSLGKVTRTASRFPRCGWRPPILWRKPTAHQQEAGNSFTAGRRSCIFCEIELEQEYSLMQLHQEASKQQLLCTVLGRESACSHLVERPTGEPQAEQDS